MDVLSPYEQEIEKRKMLNNHNLKSLLADVDNFMTEQNIMKTKKTSAPVRRSYNKKATAVPYDYSPPRTRARSSQNSESSSLISSSNSAQHLNVRLPFNFRFGKRRPKYSDDYDDESDEDFGKKKTKKRRRRVDFPRNTQARKIIPVKDVTDEMLKNIADKSTKKIYNKTYGTCCHQCRQKTIDTKTCCRSSECTGIRGQFCGICLLNRYGEEVKTALLDPDWKCPPCRDICNCSFCLARKGYNCTGIMIYEAKEHGFNSVKDYLESVEKK